MKKAMRNSRFLIKLIGGGALAMGLIFNLHLGFIDSLSVGESDTSLQELKAYSGDDEVWDLEDGCRDSGRTCVVN